MKIRIISVILSACVGCIVNAQVPVHPAKNELYCEFSTQDSINFVSPSKVYYPETWFHYIGGNVSMEGITADLEAIANAGFSGVQFFHGQFGGPWPGVEQQITCLSPLWDGMVRHTATECQRLGLRFTMQNCPGWAMAGGPWIKPENAMRHLVWSRIDINGTGKIEKKLPVPQSSSEEWRDYNDLMVIAFPTPKDDEGEALKPILLNSNKDIEWKNILSGETDKPLHLEAITDDEPYWFEIEFQDAVVVRTLELPSSNEMNHPWCFQPDMQVIVEAYNSDGEFQEVLNVNLPQSNTQDNYPISLSCSEANVAKKYRITLINQHDISLKFLRFYSAARKNSWESQAGWVLRSIERSGDAKEYNPDVYLNLNQIQDLTKLMDEQGVLKWNMPNGKWTILRIGHVNTGRKNNPAPPEGTGWECNKLSKEGSTAQFNGYIGRLVKKNGPLSDGLLNGLLMDSWECYTQTWTSDLFSEFERIAGYPLQKWIPALFGYIIQDSETTYRFLCDWRNVLNKLLVENFYGNMSQLAAQNHLSVTYETGPGDVFPTDIMEYYKYADVPMCEFWQPMEESFVGSLNFKPIKPATSAARLYGKPRIAAESFTSFTHTWDEHWQMLKEVANTNMVEGVTHLVFHTYTHNPQVGFLPPGTSFSGAGIGTPFLRGQTWWKYMPEFTGYFARCGYMLERGNPVSDVLWYLGDEVNHKPDQNADFPQGYKYDYCNPDVLLNRLSVKDGNIVTPEGIAYRVLWLAEVPRMRPETIEKLYELVRSGATLVGDAPQGLATLTGGEESQHRFEKALRSIWGEHAFKGIRQVGKGRVVSGLNLDESLKMLRISPDVQGSGTLWLHRTSGNADWYFVTVPEGKSFDGELSFRSEGYAEIWNPVTGEIIPADYTPDGGRTLVRLSLEASESCFVVFQEGTSPEKCTKKQKVQSIPITDHWTLRYPQGWGAPESIEISTLKPWKDLAVSDEARAFSGSVQYETEVVVPKDRGYRYILELGRVDMIASVSVNGTPVRTLWSAPYSLDITDALRKGDNRISIEVTSTWFNRLVYDASLPESERKTWALKYPSKDAPLRDSGLLGPVQITVWKE